MHDWVQILYIQWYIKTSTHEITWVCFELNELQKVYYIISCSQSQVHSFQVLLNKVGLCAQKCHRYKKKSSILY